MRQISAGVWCTCMPAESSTSCRPRRTELRVRVMPAAGCCLGLSRFSDSLCDPLLRVYIIRSGTCTGGDRAAASLPNTSRDNKNRNRPASFLHSNPLSAIVLRFFYYPSHKTVCARLPTTTQTAEHWGHGAGWIISSTQRRGLEPGHAHQQRFVYSQFTWRWRSAFTHGGQTPKS